MEELAAWAWLSFILSQVREELGQELEQVKKIQSIMSSFKVPVDSPAYSPRGDRVSHPVEPEGVTRDPAIWPPPTPAEQPNK